MISVNEECDDANLDPDDGCSATCIIEPDSFCVGQGLNSCAVCGNSSIDGPETCDDGNLVSGDGCSN